MNIITKYQIDNYASQQIIPSTIKIEEYLTKVALKKYYQDKKVIIQRNTQNISNLNIIMSEKETSQNYAPYNSITLGNNIIKKHSLSTENSILFNLPTQDFYGGDGPPAMTYSDNNSFILQAGVSANNSFINSKKSQMMMSDSIFESSLVIQPKTIHNLWNCLNIGEALDDKYYYQEMTPGTNNLMIGKNQEMIQNINNSFVLGEQISKKSESYVVIGGTNSVTYGNINNSFIQGQNIEIENPLSEDEENSSIIQNTLCCGCNLNYSSPSKEDYTDRGFLIGNNLNISGTTIACGKNINNYEQMMPAKIIMGRDITLQNHELIVLNSFKTIADWYGGEWYGQIDIANKWIDVFTISNKTVGSLKNAYIQLKKNKSNELMVLTGCGNLSPSSGLVIDLSDYIPLHYRDRELYCMTDKKPTYVQKTQCGTVVTEKEQKVDNNDVVIQTCYLYEGEVASWRSYPDISLPKPNITVKFSSDKTFTGTVPVYFNFQWFAQY